MGAHSKDGNFGKAMHTPNPQRIYDMTKKFKIPEETEHYFPGCITFMNSAEQKISRPLTAKRIMNKCYAGKKKRRTVKAQLMINNHGIILHKMHPKKEEEKDDCDIYRNNHSLSPETNCKCV